MNKVTEAYDRERDEFATHLRQMREMYERSTYESNRAYLRSMLRRFLAKESCLAEEERNRAAES